MIRKTLFILFMLSTYVSFSQDTSRNDVIFGDKYAKYPEFKNGMKGLYEFIQANIVYPQSVNDNFIEGVVYIEYIVDTLGYTSNHKILKGIREDIDNEALRVAKLIKYDKPAFSWRDEPIECVYYLPIKFTLHPKKPKKWWQFWRE
ncbi:MAG: energy transducer TonB [Bacteroidales bacterium]